MEKQAKKEVVTLKEFASERAYRKLNLHVSKIAQHRAYTASGRDK